MAEETKKLCMTMVENGDLEELPKERVFEEIKKLLLKAEKPSIGFELLKELHILRYFPELSTKNWIVLDRLSSHKNIRLSLAILTFGLDEEKVEQFMLRLSDEVKLIASVKSLVKGHTKVLQNDLNDVEIRRLSTTVDMKELAIICENRSILERAKVLGVDQHAPKELLQGRDLIALGYNPSGVFSKILSEVYELQIQGKIINRDEALKYVKEYPWQ